MNSDELPWLLFMQWFNQSIMGRGTLGVFVLLSCVRTRVLSCVCTLHFNWRANSPALRAAVRVVAEGLRVFLWLDMIWLGGSVACSTYLRSLLYLIGTKTLVGGDVTAGLGYNTHLCWGNTNESPPFSERKSVPRQSQIGQIERAAPAVPPTAAASPRAAGSRSIG